jgi:S-adenosylmethionine-diacylglycerol 3-amino-3-carboxypropyl transferase
MFAQSWEDPACDLAALSVRPGETMVAITSGGDNVLSFLIADPARIFSIDINPLQTAMLGLKMAAFRRLDHSELLELLGVRPPVDAWALYHRIRGDLPESAQRFWDQKEPWFRHGLLSQGGFERYFGILRKIVRLAVGRRTVERLFATDPGAQQDFYDRKWNNARWRFLVRIGCSRWVLGRALDPSWFADSQTESFGDHFRDLGEHALANLPACSNYFLSQILRGEYLDESAMPDYLRPEHFALIRSRLERVQPITSDIGDALGQLPERSVDVFALSNVFEYGPAQLFEGTKVEILRTARPGARVCLRNLLAPRRLADDPAFEVDVDLSERLRLADRGFIYKRFEAAVVKSRTA